MAMTQKEIDTLIENVKTGAYTIEDALKEIADSAKGKDVRKALYALGYTLNQEGKAGSVDLLARKELESKASKVELNTETSERRQEIAVERSRIDNLTKMEEGSTTGDAELQDIRVGANGKTYANAGDAVRGQVGDIDRELSDFEKAAVSEMKVQRKYQVGYYSVIGFSDSNTEFARNTNMYPAGKYKISKLASSDVTYGYMATAYISDKEGEALTGRNFLREDTTIESDRDFYITVMRSIYDEGTGRDITDTDLAFIDNNFSVTRIINENGNTLEDRVKELEGSAVSLDENLTDPAKAAPANLVGELKGDLADLENTVQNIEWTDGCFLQDSSVTQGNGRSISNYLLCNSGDTVSYIAETSNIYLNCICFYDIEKVFISGVQGVDGNDNSAVHTTVAPDNAYFMRISILTSQKDVAFAKCDNAEIKGAIEDIYEYRNDKKEEEQRECDITNYALFVDLIEGTDWMNGSFRKNSQSAANTSTTRVVLDKSKDIYSSNTYTGRAVFFDADDKYISQANLYYNCPVKKENFPENAVYVRFWFNHSDFSADKWATTSRNNSTFPRTEYSTIKKKKNTRPRIDIYTSDTEIEIYKKLVNAVYTQDCDVYFEQGRYNFDSVYEYIKDSYNGQGDAFEMLLGGNCRYYMYGCTFYAKYTGTYLTATGYSLFGCHRHADSYEVFGGTWIAENCVYVVHDEASGEADEYHRIYHDVTMQYIKGVDSSWLSKCVGGGMGLNGHCVFDGCTFLTDNDAVPAVQWHGCKTGTEENPANFKLNIHNCYLEHNIALDYFGDTYANNNGYANISGCSFESKPSFGSDWNVKAWNNEVRTTN